jgi:hypothetical protein
MEKLVSIQISIPPAVFQTLQAIARRDVVSLSSAGRIALMRGLEDPSLAKVIRRRPHDEGASP